MCKGNTHSLCVHRLHPQSLNAKVTGTPTVCVCAKVTPTVSVCTGYTHSLCAQVTPTICVQRGHPHCQYCGHAGAKHIHMLACPSMTINFITEHCLLCSSRSLGQEQHQPWEPSSSVWCRRTRRPSCGSHPPLAGRPRPQPPLQQPCIPHPLHPASPPHSPAHRHALFGSAS